MMCEVFCSEVPKTHGALLAYQPRFMLVLVKALEFLESLELIREFPELINIAVSKLLGALDSSLESALRDETIAF